MAVVTIFSASYCHGEEVAAKVADQLGFDLRDDETLIAAASEEFKTSADKLRRAMEQADEAQKEASKILRTVYGYTPPQR